MNRETWCVTAVLMALMVLCIVAINWVPQQEVQVPTSTLGELDRAGLVEQVRLGPQKLVVTLRELVSIRTQEGRLRTRMVGSQRSDSTRALERAWEERGIVELAAERSDPVKGEWLFIGMLVAGLCFVVVKAYRDRRDGSVRKRIEDLKKEYERGLIGEEEYSRRLSELIPYE